MKKAAIYFLLLSICIASCSTRRIYKDKNGTYNYTIRNYPVSSAPVIIGSLFEYDTKEPIKTNGAIKLDNKILSRRGTDGKYLFTLQPGKYRLTGTAYPYTPYETKPIKINQGDALRLNIYLKLAKVDLH